MRGECIFVFNFNPENSFSDYGFEAPAGEYGTLLDSDSSAYGGFDRVDDNQRHFTMEKEGQQQLSVYIPSRTALVLCKMDKIE